MSKVHGSPSRSTALTDQLKKIEKQALNDLKQRQAKSDASILGLEKAEPSLKPQLEALKQKVDQKFSVERSAVEARFSQELALLQQLDGKPAAKPAPKPTAPKAQGHKAPSKPKAHGKKKPTTQHAASGGVNKAKLPANYRKYADEIQASAKKYGLPPAYVAAVMDRETGGRNILGDGGHGHGLMQIDDRSHGPWLRSHHNGLDPKSNIDYGCSILAANLKAAHGHGLKGDAALKFAASAYNAGLGGATAGLRSGNSDARTTGHNYGHDVLQRMKRFEPGFSGGAATHAGKTHKTTHEPKPKSQSALRKKIVQMAMSQVGTREDGNNGGGARKYQQYFGRGREAWCADFVSWIYSHSGEKLNFAYCPYLESHLKATHKWKGKHNPQPGDVVLFDWNHDGTPDHVGIVKRALGNGMVETIEGNTTNPSGSGEGVFVKRRPLSEIAGFGSP